MTRESFQLSVHKVEPHDTWRGALRGIHTCELD